MQGGGQHLGRVRVAGGYSLEIYFAVVHEGLHRDFYRLPNHAIVVLAGEYDDRMVRKAIQIAVQSFMDHRKVDFKAVASGYSHATEMLSAALHARSRPTSIRHVQLLFRGTARTRESSAAA